MFKTRRIVKIVLTIRLEKILPFGLTFEYGFDFGEI